MKFFAVYLFLGEFLCAIGSGNSVVLKKHIADMQFITSTIKFTYTKDFDDVLRELAEIKFLNEEIQENSVLCDDHCQEQAKNISTKLATELFFDNLSTYSQANIPSNIMPSEGIVFIDEAVMQFLNFVENVMNSIAFNLTSEDLPNEWDQRFNQIVNLLESNKTKEIYVDVQHSKYKIFSMKNHCERFSEMYKGIRETYRTHKIHHHLLNSQEFEDIIKKDPQFKYVEKRYLNIENASISATTKGITVEVFLPMTSSFTFKVFDVALIKTQILNGNSSNVLKHVSLFKQMAIENEDFALDTSSCTLFPSINSSTFTNIFCPIKYVLKDFNKCLLSSFSKDEIDDELCKDEYFFEIRSANEPKTYLIDDLVVILPPEASAYVSCDNEEHKFNSDFLLNEGCSLKSSKIASKYAQHVGIDSESQMKILKINELESAEEALEKLAEIVVFSIVAFIIAAVLITLLLKCNGCKFTSSTKTDETGEVSFKSVI